MDIEHCLTVRKIRICEVLYAADKTSSQRLSICRPRPPVASDLPAKDRTKVQKISIVEINLGIFLKIHNYCKDNIMQNRR